VLHEPGKEESPCLKAPTTDVLDTNSCTKLLLIRVHANGLRTTWLRHAGLPQHRYADEYYSQERVPPHVCAVTQLSGAALASAWPSANLVVRPEALLPAEVVRGAAPVARGLEPLPLFTTGENDDNGVTCPRLSVLTIKCGPAPEDLGSVERCCSGEAAATLSCKPVPCRLGPGGLTARRP